MPNNRDIALGSAHDAKGNVTAFGTRGFTYSSENLLLTAPGSTSLSYDPMLRLYQQATGGTATRFAYDGLDRIAEYDGSNVLQRRYVHGPGMDEPLVWYEGSGTTDRRFLHADERGSIVAVSDASGAMLGINRYDEFGQPQSSGGAGTLTGSFGYTGQAWLAGTGLYYYKARVYDPDLGRFLQPDPIGYWDSPNLYAYVANDPVNWVDPLGLKECQKEQEPVPVPAPQGNDVLVCGDKNDPGPVNTSIGGGVGFGPSGAPAAPPENGYGEEIVVTGKKIWRRWSDFMDNVRQRVASTWCDIPAFGWGGGADLYAGVGGSLSGGYSFDLARGRVGIFYTVGVGVGIGGGGYTAIYVNPSSGISASLSGNVGGGAGLVGLGVSRTLIGATTGGYGGSAARSLRGSTRIGGFVTANANVALTHLLA